MIHIQGLTKYYNNLCAVDHIDLEIRKGEIMGLLGPNGAGKTTIMRMLTGFLTPTSGAIQVKEYDIDEHPLEIKKLMGYLPESAPLYHEMLTFDYLNYVADIRNLDKERKGYRINQLADLCAINDIMHKPIGELSKGYKQRVGLAHAMMNDPEILVLDEPTSGLDPNQIIEIRNIIRQIGKEKTVILSTHILSEAEAACDRVVIIDRGKIVADGDVDTLKQSAGEEYIINISLRNATFEEVKEELKFLDGITLTRPMDEDKKVLRLRLICRSSKDIREELYLRIKQTGWILLELHQEAQTLERVFRKLTREK
ncbi:ABC transporter ATP-binding protein [Deltaproteobacteria bacterium]|nr:ABC transporter ATP-binding protein [Deltaproteobacteria bacterium]